MTMLSNQMSTWPGILSFCKLFPVFKNMSGKSKTILFFTKNRNIKNWEIEKKQERPVW